MKKILLIIGTRPEAIKMAPVVKAINLNHPEISLKTLSTGQHNSLLQDGLSGFNITIDKNLRIENLNNDLAPYFAALIAGISSELSADCPDLILVHGDTASAAAASISAHMKNIPVAHVEAGLRSHRLDSPWPEEANRRIIDALSTLLFCPTEFSRKQITEDMNSHVFVTGNTVLDALKFTLEETRRNSDLVQEFASKYSYLGDEFILVTQHRRESFGEKHEDILNALNIIASINHPVLFPVHPNPSIRSQVHKTLTNPNIYIVDPVSYPEFVYLMSIAKLAISDSGGIQEEAPSLGLPLLITRELTERPEALLENTNEIVGHDSVKIIERASYYLNLPRSTSRDIFRTSVFGDGSAGEKIAELCSNFLTK